MKRALHPKLVGKKCSLGVPNGQWFIYVYVFVDYKTNFGCKSEWSKTWDLRNHNFCNKIYLYVSIYSESSTIKILKHLFSIFVVFFMGFFFYENESA